MTNEPKKVLQVWFIPPAGERNWLNPSSDPSPSQADKELYGVPLWRPNGSIVGEWAIDYIVCSDTRWVAFGPFVNREEALAAFADLPARLISGYHIINEHCWESQKLRKNFWEWTDG